MSRATEKNKIQYFVWILFLPVLLDGFNSFVVEVFHITNTSTVTLCITGVVAICGWLMICMGFKKTSMVLYGFLLLGFVLNFLLFDYSQEYLLDQSMWLIYLFYLPVSVMVVKDIRDWSSVFDAAKPLCLLTGLIGAYVVFFTEYTVRLNYMEFSYAILPFVLFSYVLLRTQGDIVTILSFSLSCISVLIFGARAPILFILAFIFYCEIIAFKNRTKHIFTLLVIVLVLIGLYIAFKDAIMIWATNFAASTGSRTILKILNGDLFASAGRDVVSERTSKAISEMGLRIYGLFGDRYTCGVVYAHNIGREILLSFGWILGILIMGVFIFAILYFYFKGNSKDIRVLMGIALLGIFARYIISGSFVIEGRFYICIALIASLIKQSKYLKQKE